MKMTITSLSVMPEPFQDTVTMSGFTISDTQDGLTGSVSYSVNLLPVPADNPNFTPYAQVTEPMAIEWTVAALGPERVASMEAEVQAQIDAQKIVTPESTPLPW